jgi:hypothetical protein
MLSRHFRVDDLKAAATYIGDCDRAGLDAYVGLLAHSTDLGPHKRGSAADKISAAVLWADIDRRAPGHAAQNLPETEQDLCSLLEAVGLPPSFVIDSGGGWHAYWRLTTPIVLDAVTRAEFKEVVKGLQARLASAAQARGWHFDLTFDLARVLRPAGTHNRKSGRDVKPEVCFAVDPDTGSAYEYDVLKRFFLRSRSAFSGAGPFVSTSATTPSIAAPSPLFPTSASSTEPTPSDEWDEEQTVSEIRRKIKASRHPERAAILGAFLRGESFAQPGERDSTCQKLASWLCWYTGGRGDIEAIVEMARPSLAQMAASSPDDFITDEQFADKVSRAMGEAKTKEAARLATEKAFTDRIRGATAFVSSEQIPHGAPQTASDLAVRQDLSSSDGCAPPAGSASGGATAEASTFIEDPTVLPEATHEDLERAAASQSLASGLTYSREHFCHLLVVECDNTFYVYSPKGYQKVGRPSVVAFLDRNLRLPADVWSPWATDAKGNSKPKPLSRMLSEIGTVANGGLVYDGAAKTTFFAHEDRTFHTAIWTLRRDLEPCFFEECDRWLRLFARDRYERVLDWIATIARTDRATSALVLLGPPGLGKDLITEAVARVFGDVEPIPMDSYFRDFNAELIRCPVLFANEQLPKDWKGQPISSTEMRRMISSATHGINAKYGAKALLRGHVRAVLATNNLDALRPSGEAMNASDYEAVAARYTLVHVGREAKAYLDSIGGMNATKTWVTGESRLIRHFLHVIATRDVKPGLRFLVEGDGGELADAFAVHGTVGKLILEAILGQVVTPRKISEDPIVVGSGKVLVKIQPFHRAWSTLTRGTGDEARRLRPAQQDFANEVRALAGPEERLEHRSGPRAFPIRLSLLERLADTVGIDSHELKTKIATPNAAVLST